MDARLACPKPPRLRVPCRAAQCAGPLDGRLGTQRHGCADGRARLSGRRVRHGRAQRANGQPRMGKSNDGTREEVKTQHVAGQWRRADDSRHRARRARRSRLSLMAWAVGGTSSSAKAQMGKNADWSG
ncbi:hypothetical protein ERJ75_000569600 [Trypanosoma vivax]|nr:hypothetical protein ERJ75_000569600 [Trypanosoma vivax]